MKLSKRIAKEGNPQDLSNIVWLGVCTVGCESVELFEAVAGQYERIGRSNVQDLSMTCWAFAKAGHRAEALFGAGGR